MTNNTGPIKSLQSKKLFALDQPIKEFYKLADAKEHILFSCKNTNLHIFDYNEQLPRLYQLDKSGVLGQTAEQIFNDNINVAKQIHDADQEILLTGKTKWFLRKFNLTRNSVILSIYDTGFRTLLKDSANNAVGLLGFGIGTNSLDKETTPFLTSKELKSFKFNPEVYCLLHCYPALYTIQTAGLTRRETEILYAFMRYHSMKRIAKKLKNISPRTVETHIEHCKTKLNVQNKTELLELLWQTNFAYLSLELISKLCFITNFHQKPPPKNTVI